MGRSTPWTWTGYPLHRIPAILRNCGGECGPTATSQWSILSTVEQNVMEKMQAAWERRWQSGTS